MMQLRTYNKLFLFFLLVSCYTVRDISTVNMAAIYRSNDQLFHPEFAAYNETDSFVSLFIKILPNEFLFSRQTDEQFRAIMEVHVDVIKSFEETTIIDSSTAKFPFELAEKENYKTLSMQLPLKSKGKFLLRCVITDDIKGNREEYFVQLDRISNPSRQDFLITDLDGRPYMKSYFSQLDTLNISYQNKSTEKFYCKYYYRDFMLAPPPFSFDIHEEFNYHPDSFFVLTKEQLKTINLSKEGFYHIQTDTTIKDGLTLYRFAGGFPEITSFYQMIESLRYLTSKKEYEEIKNASSPKSMLDNYWLTHGGNEEKTRMLIKKYYTRVKEANKFFTSHTEGWRTDRGMIYIIFGSPGTIYRSNESESWIYGTPNSSLALNFFFIKVNNPFTENDFTLTRSPSYENAWYRAVEVWRQGRAYNSIY